MGDHHLGEMTPHPPSMPRECIRAAHDQGRNALRRLLKARDPDSMSELSQMLREKKMDLAELVESGKTPLHLAAWRGAPAVVSLLLSHSADIDAVSTGPSNYGKSALFYAITRCRDDVVRVLLSAGPRLMCVRASVSHPRLTSSSLPDWKSARLQYTHR